MSYKYSDLFCRRTLDSKFSTTITFIKDCRRPVLRTLSVFLIPLCFIQTLYNSLVGDSFWSTGSIKDVPTFAFDLLVMILIDAVAFITIITIVYGMMKLYHSRNENKRHDFMIKMSLNGILDAIHTQPRAIWHTMVSILLLCVLLLAIACIGGVTAGVMYAAINGDETSLFIIGMTFGVLLLLAVPFWILAVPAYSFEKLGFWNGLMRGFHYGIRTWGSVIVIMTTYLLLDFIVTLPFSLWHSPITNFLTNYITYLIEASCFITLGYQYGHAKAKIGNKAKITT